MDFWQTVAAIGLPGIIITAVVGFIVRRIEKRLDKEEAERKAQEEARRSFERYQLAAQTATMALCEANALALQNGRCNGETHAALAYLQKVKHEQRDFLTSQGIDHIF